MRASPSALGFAAVLIACAEASRAPEAARPPSPAAPSSAASPEAPAPAASSEPDGGTAPATTSPPPRIAPAGSIASAPAAVAAFRKLWPEASSAIAAHHAAAAEHWSQVLAERSTKPGAAKDDCASYRKRIESTLAPTEYATAFLYGELASLEAGATCWEVSLAQGFNTLLVYLRAKDGQVLVIWAPPEG